MLRHSIHVAAALLTFTAGFLTAGSHRELAYALPVALAVFVFTSLFEGFRLQIFDSHRLKIAALTFLLWIPLLAFFLPLIAAPGGFRDCVFTYTSDDAEAFGVSEEVTQTTDTESDAANVTAFTVNLCGGANVPITATNSAWAGVVDRKAITRPAPFRPPGAKAARVEGAVAVSVLIDESGRVLQAQAISGHPLLRQAAMDAACRARFSPTPVDGPPLRISGVLTYRFSR